MQFVVEKCLAASELLLFKEFTESPIELEDYTVAQESNLAAVILFLQTVWTHDIATTLTEIIIGIGKGAFDPTTDNRFIFENSKLWRLLELIKQHMQSALRNIVESSTEIFGNNLCAPCEIFLELPEDFEWSDDLITSPFTSRTIFSMDLMLDENGASLSTDPVNFETTLVKILETAVLECHTIPSIEPFVLTRLFFDYANLRLSPAGLLDEKIQKLLRHIKFCYKKALIPLYAYLKKFDQFVKLHILDITKYVQYIKETRKHSIEIKDEINRQFKLLKELEKILPLTTDIGPFRVNVSELKMKLRVKRKTIIRKLMEMLCGNLKVDNNLIFI